MDGDVSGVRILPSHVEFKDTEVDTLYRINITVKNISKSSKEIRYYFPQTKNFKLKVKNPDKPVAPGLEVPAVIEFESSDAREFKDRLVVTVDGVVVEVPLVAKPCQPILTLPKEVDFGYVVANSKVIAKEITLFNHGSKEGEFKIKYSGDKAIAIIPSSGRVSPNTSQVIKVEYVTKLPGHFDEHAKVKLEGQEQMSLRIKGDVVEGSLELLAYGNQHTLDCVQFGATYYGTDKTESATLYNNGPEPVCFVTVLDEGAVGQELGVDLSKSTAVAQATKDNDNGSLGEMNGLTFLVTAIPNQGCLAPYEKIPIFFRFSPRWNVAQKGFNCTQDSPPRQDFALFMNVKVVGASQGFGEESKNKEKSNVEGSTLEIALTGTALPALVSLGPQTKFDFGECPVNEHVDALCTLSNLSSALPITFQFRRIAHFTARPPNGKIKPGQSQDIIFSFAPNQVGTFKPTQYIDIIGPVADNRNPFLMHLQVIHSSPIYFFGKSDPIVVKKDPVFNPGITPKITNEVGMYVDTSVASSKKTPMAAMLNARGTKLHRIQFAEEDKPDDKTLVAFPNDRAQSVRPSFRKESYKTIFTHSKRHTYVDPDYAYDDQQLQTVRNHKNSYVAYLDDLREQRRIRQMAKDFKENDNKTDIGIKPATGIRAKKILLDEVKPDKRPPTPPNAAFRLLSTKELARAEKVSAKKKRDGLNAIPNTSQEKADCSKILSPQQLHQVIIGPPTIDFHEVCLKSISQKELNIVNNLDQFIHINVNVDCRELRQTSPLSQVVPPCSKATLPLIFESNTRGRFQRSLDYTINGFYKHHITVFAEVVPVSLHLSTQELVLEPQIGLPADAGIRGVITLENKLNYPADFTWSPILGERGTAFSIRPATGTVDGNTWLACEVVFHPSYMAPEDGEFALQVHGGNALNLHCVAKLGVTNVSFIDRRIMFGQVPLHLSTTRTAMLKNNSLNHAYFQVLDPNPFPGLTVSPIHGVVPVGGVAELKIQLTPNAVMKFDTRVNISIRGWKTLELRMGGTVEPPMVDIDLQTFNLGGVYCGSSQTTSFKLVNKAHTKARIEFDLSRYADFSLDFPDRQSSEDITFQVMNPGMYTVTLDSDEDIECELLFKPTEVASYDFIIPVTMNQTGAPTPSPTPFPPTPAPSNKNSLQHIINPRPIQVHISTPRRKVIATALRQPLQLSTHSLKFGLSPATHELASSSGIGQSKGTMLVNNSDKKLKWAIDLSKGNQVLENGTFKFLHPSGMPYLSYGDRGGVEGTLEPGQTVNLGVIFCPDKPGHYEVQLPVILDDQYDKPYQYIYMSGELKAPRLWFDPLAIVLTPVPLQMEMAAEFTIYAANYTKRSTIKAEVPDVECEDGSKVSPLKVEFLEGKDVKPCCAEEGHHEPYTMACRVTFQSSKPVSFNQPIKFVDDLNNSFNLPVTATADNCLMTCYPFLAQHRADHQIVCEQGTTLKGRKTASRESINVGEAVLIPCDSPHRPGSRPSTTATSSNFEISSSSYEENSSQSVTESTYPSTPREGAVNKFTNDSEVRSVGGGRQDLQSRSLGSALFPEEDTEEGIFHTEVLLAVQRWFSSQGWPGGPNPITLPDSLRSGISKKPAEEKVKNAKGGSWESNNLKKEFRTVYDMISHLSGKHVPGIPLNNALPKDALERAKQVYWQHCTLLTFLKTQGACVASIKPEYLMEPGDYKGWVRLQKQVEAIRNKSGHWEILPKTEDEEAIEEQLFEAVSKRAWTDVLLQLLKVLVLSKVTPRQFKNLPSPYKGCVMPMVDPDPQCSNVYSISERIVLLWLNHHYEQQRQLIWANCPKGGIPPSRWVVNFDYDLLDGLVLAAILAAHVPFLIKDHLNDMYTHPATAEQCLHNALKVVNAMRYIGIDYDIQAIDVTDPNPISLLLLCVHLYNSLPQYIPKNSIDFVGGLHVMVNRQIKLNNPSTKPLVYNAIMGGVDANDFTLPKGDTIVISPRATVHVCVEHTSRFLRPAEAVLVLVGRRQGSSIGSTLVFNLQAQIDHISPKTTAMVEAPCYELTMVPLEVDNPFSLGGDFRIIVNETPNSLRNTDGASMVSPKKKKPKKVRSKIDNGSQRPDSPEPAEESAVLGTSQSISQNQDEKKMQAFFSPARTVYIDACGMAHVEIHFLPFTLGNQQCSIIFINDKVGEFIYNIEANATLPVPSQLPFKAGPHSVRITSAAAAGSTRGQQSEDEIVYWKCESNQVLKESLMVPISNMARDKALMVAAQQNMSEVELARRQVTKTLASGTLTAKAIDQLSNTQDTFSVVKPKKQPKNIMFTVEVDSKHFSVQNKFSVPNPAHHQHMASQTSGASSTAPNRRLPMGDGHIELPVEFCSKEAGTFPCEIVLRSDDDVRVYCIECTVTPEGAQAELEFQSPVHQPITQEIPISNQTNHDWPMQACIEGAGFAGPVTLLAKAFQTTIYPLMFRPIIEGVVRGHLVLTNTADGVDHTFQLLGKGERPLPLEQISLHSMAKQSLTRSMDVPNITKRKLHYRVESDLPYISGPEYITVLPGQVGTYDVTVIPLQRGSHKGVIMFVAGDNPVNEVDSDGDEVLEEEEDTQMKGYCVWYSVELTVDPPLPEKTLAITCACQRKAMLEVGVSNPTNIEVTLEAQVTGQGLSGPSSIVLPPKAKGVYELVYFPAIVGQYKGSLVFFHEAVGEFWYDLNLVAEKPSPSNLPHMECELGRWARQHISLSNPTEETLFLIPTVTNTNNFVLERENDRPLELRPHSDIKVPVTFMPSTLGSGDHVARISFHCEQLGEWVYHVSGTGLLPQPQDPVSITAVAGANSTLIIPFRNPLDIAVIMDVKLIDREKEVQAALEIPDQEPSPFCLLLKLATDVRLGPKSTLDIPISFAPEDMRMFEAECYITMRQETGETWRVTPSMELKASQRDMKSWESDQIKWVYPIHGYPELSQTKDTPAAIIECQARERVEERLEVTLSGVAPAAGGPKRGIKTRAVTPHNEAPRIPEGVVVAETFALAEEFCYELLFGGEEQMKDVEPAVALQLVRQHRDKQTGLVVLVFNIIYAPYKSMAHDVQLLVKGATGGLWRFPLKFVATEPDPDDTVIIEALGLNIESSVGFRLNSQSKQPITYNAYFMAGSDAEFSVSPSSGELLPVGTNGTLIKISFNPNKYGKIYQGKLVVQCPDMQWVYNIRGVLPDYTPPRGYSSHPMAGPHPDPRRRADKLNYIKENLRLTTTAVSSPIKGAPVIKPKFGTFVTS